MKLQKAQMIANDVMAEYMTQGAVDAEAAGQLGAISARMAEAFAAQVVDEPIVDGPFLLLARKLTKVLRDLLAAANDDEEYAALKAAQDAMSLATMSQCIDQYETIVQALSDIAAQDSGIVGSTAKSDCMAATASAALRNIGVDAT